MMQDRDLAGDQLQEAIFLSYHQHCWAKTTSSARQEIGMPIRRPSSAITNKLGSQKVLLEKVLSGDHRRTRQCQTYEGHGKTSNYQAT
jgi:hypothetical protein